MVHIKDIYDPNCTQCNLGTTCKNSCIPGEGTGKFMIVLNYPDTRDDALGKQDAEGEKLKVLNVLLKAVGIDRKEVFITYLVKCRGQVKNMTEENINTCFEYLKAEINILRPKAIIAMGGDVFKKLTHGEIEKSLTSQRGNLIKVEYDLFGENFETTIIPTLSTSYALQLSKSKPTLKKIGMDIYKGYCLATDKEPGKTDTTIVKVNSLAQVHELVQYCKSTGIACFDFETTGLEQYAEDFKVTLLAISFQPGTSYTIPLFHFESRFTEEESHEILNIVYTGIMQDPNIRKIAHNSKYDLRCFGRYGLADFRGVIEDTVYIHHALYPGKSHKLKEISAEVFPQFSGYEDDVSKYKWDAVPLHLLEQYGGSDTDLTLRLWITYTAKLIVQPELYRVYRNVMLSSLKNLFKFEHYGVAIDREHINLAVTEVTKIVEQTDKDLRNFPEVIKYERIKHATETKAAIIKTTDKLTKWKETHNPGTKTQIKLEAQLEALKTGSERVIDPLNFGSSKQLADLLYTDKGFKLKGIKDWKTGKTTGTGEPVLKQLADAGGFIPKLLEYRSLNKTLNTYLVGLRACLDNNNRIHSSFHITGTRTGRISSSNPNIQNITQPSRIKYPLAKKAAEYIKEIFITPGKDYSMVQVDFSQMELRLIAWYSQCKEMLRAYANNEDLHALTAATVNGMTIEQFYTLPKDKQKLLRYQAKAVNFGFIYGASASTFRTYAKTQYGIDFTPRQAAKIRREYFKKYPELLDYHKTQIKFARKNGYVKTMFGRKRFLPEIKSNNERRRAEAERQAINTPIQGTSGEITMFCASLLDGRLDRSVQGWNSVHDSILYYIPNNILTSQLRVIKSTCENTPIEKYFNVSFSDGGRTPVKMVVDFEHSGDCWKNLKEMTF